MTLLSSPRRFARGLRSAALACAALSLSCAPGTDFFISVQGIPGGAFLGAWVSPDGSQAFLAGGLVGVDPATSPDPMAMGRLVRYRQGRFETLCRTPSVLWWVFGVDGVVFASGEDGMVLRYDEARGCVRLPLGGSWPRGLPTLWGVWGPSANDLTFVGGSALPDGPRGVLLRYDGAAFTQAVLPSAMQDVNLYKLAPSASGLFVVGARGTIARRPLAGGEFAIEPVPRLGGDDLLFTVACPQTGSEDCIAVGGVGIGRVLRRGAAGAWTLDPISEENAGLNGVWIGTDRRAFIVGNQGTTLFTDSTGAQPTLRPPMPAVRDPLHAVAGGGGLVIAVGGELFDSRPSQRGTILLRGPQRGGFVFDGMPVASTGALREALP
ncbi:MAG: hypothetical protein Q8Q09_27595 [Deltaproteobacteria bacterium]|nr:hypothetical protein [Deltaproteobacteria bacterium]